MPSLSPLPASRVGGGVRRGRLCVAPHQDGGDAGFKGALGIDETREKGGVASVWYPAAWAIAPPHGAAASAPADPCQDRSRRTPLPNGIAGRPYAVGLKGEQGKLPLSWSGSPAGGLALDTRSGELTGTPERAWSFHFPVTVTERRDRSHTKTFELTVVSSGELAITSPSPLPQGIRGQPYSQQLKADGRQGRPVRSPVSRLRQPRPRSTSRSG